MAEFRCPQLADLLMQARYAPHKQRLLQVDACEALLRLIRPEKSYPFEFVRFHITGYRRPNVQAPSAEIQNEAGLAYEALLADLPRYADRLSRTLDLHVDQFDQQVYTIASLTRRFRVCRKTITRWRGRGLIGRHMRFPDGRCRVGFLASSVRHFAQQNGLRVRRTAKFARVSHVEETILLRRLAQWAQRCPDHRRSAIVRTARRFGRSEETVRGLLARHEHDLANYLSPVSACPVAFSKRPTGMDESERVEIARLFESGQSIRKLSQRFQRSRSGIYRAITLERARRLAETTIAYIPSATFSEPNAKQAYLETPVGLFDDERDESADREAPVGDAVGAYLSDIAAGPLLNAEQEHFLFAQYNYLKHLAAQLQQQIDLEYPQARVLNGVRRRLDQAEEVRQRLARCNLRLVVSVARKHTRHEQEMLDLIGEGNVTLLNAVEKFDFTRGVKFSTYATWALMKRYATLRRSDARMPNVASNDDMLDIDRDHRREGGRAAALDAARKVVSDVMNCLEERERLVVRAYYGLDEAYRVKTRSQRHSGQSFRQIGELLGLSKERIRQIELSARQKLRTLLGPQALEFVPAGKNELEAHNILA